MKNKISDISFNVNVKVDSISKVDLPDVSGSIENKSPESSSKNRPTLHVPPSVYKNDKEGTENPVHSSTHDLKTGRLRSQSVPTLLEVDFSDLDKNWQVSNPLRDLSDDSLSWALDRLQ